jgi:hypothetical protein
LYGYPPDMSTKFLESLLRMPLLGSNLGARTSLPDDDEKRLSYDGSNLEAHTKCTDDAR